MAKKPVPAPPKKELAYYGEMVSLQSVLPINAGLRSAQEETMISLLGSPQLPLTTSDQPDKASPLVKKLRVTGNISTHIRVSGIRPAVRSLGDVIAAAIKAEADAGHDLDSVLSHAGMIAVRYRKPTSGAPSTKVSNHAWGSAIDLALVGQDAPGNTHGQIPRFIAVLIPFFNRAGWYSGIAFADTMHFEVADGTIHKWALEGLLHP